MQIFIMAHFNDGCHWIENYLFQTRKFLILEKGKRRENIQIVQKKTPTDCQILQDDLNSLGQWETHWQMKFYVAKCHSTRVTSLAIKYTLTTRCINKLWNRLSLPNTLELLLLTTWNGVNMFLKFLLESN